MQMFHTTYKIFLASVAFFIASISFTCIAYIVYASDGLDNSTLKNLSTIFYAVSQVLLVLMLLLLGLGYTVVCGRLPNWAVICLSVFVSAFAVTYVALYIVEAATNDPALVLYRWESAPGYGIMALILAAWLFYLCCCVFTMAKHKKKSAFYGPMMVFYTLWFIAVPVTVGVNIQFVEDFVRAKVANFVEVIILFLAHLFYLVLTWPSLANKNFPFHIKTTQIGVLTLSEATRLADKQAAQGDDLSDGRQFTDFSVFTVANQRRPNFAASSPLDPPGAARLIEGRPGLDAAERDGEIPAEERPLEAGEAPDHRDDGGAGGEAGTGTAAPPAQAPPTWLREGPPGGGAAPRAGQLPTI